MKPLLLAAEAGAAAGAAGARVAGAEAVAHVPFRHGTGGGRGDSNRPAGTTIPIRHFTTGGSVTDRFLPDPGRFLPRRGVRPAQIG